MLIGPLPDVLELEELEELDELELLELEELELLLDDELDEAAPVLDESPPQPAKPERAMSMLMDSARNLLPL